MRRKASTFLELLNSFISEYLPDAVGASPNTIKSYKAAFRLLLTYMYQEKGISADEISFDILDYRTITDFLSWLEISRSCSATTKNQRLSAVAAFSSYAQNRNFSAASTFRSSVTRIPMKKSVHKRRAVLTKEEVAILLRLPDERYEIGLRNKVLLSLMYASGARAQEICDLTVRDVQFAENGASICLSGKGRKKRKIGIPCTCASLLKGYIDHRIIASLPDRHIFSSQTHEQMTISCIEEIFKKYVGIAKKLNPCLFVDDSYTPHSMRHSTASHMLEAGVPLAVIKNFLGHSSLQSTQIYAEISQCTVDKHLKGVNSGLTCRPILATTMLVVMKCPPFYADYVIMIIRGNPRFLRFMRLLQVLLGYSYFWDNGHYSRSRIMPICAEKWSTPSPQRKAYCRLPKLPWV